MITMTRTEFNTLVKDNLGCELPAQLECPIRGLHVTADMECGVSNKRIVNAWSEGRLFCHDHYDAEWIAGALIIECWQQDYLDNYDVLIHDDDTPPPTEEE